MHFLELPEFRKTVDDLSSPLDVCRLDEKELQALAGELEAQMPQPS